MSEKQQPSGTVLCSRHEAIENNLLKVVTTTAQTETKVDSIIKTLDLIKYCAFCSVGTVLAAAVVAACSLAYSGMKAEMHKATQKVYDMPEELVFENQPNPFK